jgi:hypothetical protein
VLAAAGTQSALATRSAPYIDDPQPLVVLCTKFSDAANTTVQRILEKAGSVEPAFAERYLRAIDTELARQILDYYGREWVNFDPPLDRASSQVGFFAKQYACRRPIEGSA